MLSLGSSDTADLAAQTPGIKPHDLLSEAARKTIRFHLRRMMAEENNTLEGTDIEALHAMRVATRRMRTAFRVFESYLDPTGVAPWIRELQRTGARLGVVRDMDIFREKTELYLATTPGERATALVPLIRAWDAAHTAARHALLDHLNSKRYLQFRQAFSALLETELPRVGPRTATVRRLGRQLVRQRLDLVYGFGTPLGDPNPPLTLFHQLRIEVKHARYLLEFLQEVLDPRSEGVIATLRTVQDHLGAMQDAVVACAHIENVLRWGAWEMPRQPHTLWQRRPVSSKGLSRYLAFRQAEINTLVVAFPDLWRTLWTPEFATALDEALSPLEA